MLEEDIIQVLNKALQKAGEPTSICFCWVSYLQSETISDFLIEKRDAIQLLKTPKNILLQAAKRVDRAVIRAKALEH